MAKKPIKRSPKKGKKSKPKSSEIDKIMNGTPNSTGLKAIRKMKQTPNVSKLRKSLEASLVKAKAKNKKKKK